MIDKMINLIPRDVYTAIGICLIVGVVSLIVLGILLFVAGLISTKVKKFWRKDIVQFYIMRRRLPTENLREICIQVAKVNDGSKVYKKILKYGARYRLRNIIDVQEARDKKAEMIFNQVGGYQPTHDITNPNPPDWTI